MGQQVSAHVIISGKVQGVFFRDETRKTAIRFGVTGWVRNRADGTVEALMEGLREEVEALIAWCHKGSPMSRVDHVDVKWKEYTGEFDRFEVTY